MTWVLVFLGFSALIILHEAGHFVAAKAVGMRVEKFFLFFPPKLVSIKRGETEYGIGMIPLGGFVKITGMNPDEVHPPSDREPAKASRLTTLMEGDAAGGEDDFEPLPADIVERAYYNQPVWKRVIVIGAGPAVNIVLAFIILVVLSLTAKEAVGPDLNVERVTSDSPANGRIEPGDRVVSVDGRTLNFPDMKADDRADFFRTQIGTHSCADGVTDQGCPATTPVQIVVDRDGRKVSLAVTPTYDTEAKQVLLGVQFTPAHVEPAGNSIGDATGDALDQMWFVSSRTVTTIGRIFNTEQRKQVSGVVGTSDSLHQAFDFDTRLAIFVLALISLSLGIVNLFPFLPLDGGHIFWSVVEKLRGRPVAFSTMEKASVVGFALVMVLFFVGLSNDVGRLTN
jgi:regulator of sigma E protease